VSVSAYALLLIFNTDNLSENIKRAQVLLSFMVLVALWNATCIDPGIQQPTGEPKPGSLDEQERGEGGEKKPRFKTTRWCNVCQVEQVRGTAHCPVCNCCIRGHDHHCPWMGKCIGERTSRAFYAYLFLVATCILAWSLAFQLSI